MIQSTNNILRYYLDSEPHFNIFVDMFLQNGFYSKVEKDNVIYEYISEVAVKVAEHAQKYCGFHLSLSDEEISKYFDNRYSDIQLFSIIFALILKLSKEQVSFIADKENSAISLSVLRSILCGKTIKDIEYVLSKIHSPSCQRIELDNINYPGRFYINEIQKDDIKFSYPWRRFFSIESLKHAKIATYANGVLTDSDRKICANQIF